MNKEFSYEVVEHIAVIGNYGTGTKEINIISFNGAEPKYDIRNWAIDGCKKVMGKGITLTDDEFEALRQAIR